MLPSSSSEQYLLENLQAGTTYYVALQVRDEVGNVSPISEVIQFTTLKDTTVPSIVEISPREKALDVPVNLRRVAVRFSELMDENTLTKKTVHLIDESGESISGKALYQPSLNVASFLLAETLSPGRNYTVVLSKDISDSVGTGLSRDYNFQFTTGNTKDTTPPSVLAALPHGDSTELPINLHSIGIMLSEDLDIAPISGNVLVIESSKGDALVGDVQYSEVTRFIGFHPSGLLSPFETYTVKLKGEVTDLSGNPLPPFNWRFKTGGQTDLNPPKVTGTYPERGAKDVMLEARNSSGFLSVSFDELIAPDSLLNRSFQLRDNFGQVVSGHLEYEPSQSVLRLIPGKALQADATYTVVLGAGLRDLSGNVLESDLAWSFSTISTEGELLFNVLNYPNPFNPQRTPTTLQYGLRRPAKVTLEIYSVTGDLLRTLVQDASKSAGLHQTEQWDGFDENGDVAGRGMYIYKISAREGNKKSTSDTGVILIK